MPLFWSVTELALTTIFPRAGTWVSVNPLRGRGGPAEPDSRTRIVMLLALPVGCPQRGRTCYYL